MESNSQQEPVARKQEKTSRCHATFLCHDKAERINENDQKVSDSSFASIENQLEISLAVHGFNDHSSFLAFNQCPIVYVSASKLFSFATPFRKNIFT